LAVLKAFKSIADIEIDFTELAKQAKEMEQKLGELLVQMQQAIEQQSPGEEDAVQQEPAEEEELGIEDREGIERLFERAKQDRSTAYELKRELDRLGVYREFEDRFLDLFKKPE
jgi:hypothetical protein